MDISHPVHHRISSVEFKFTSPEDIKNLSVKRITNPLIFDNLDHPSPGGVYDQALGPISFDEKCPTCSLNYHHCPGHFGHIELIAPVYNNVTFKLLYKLLQSTCFCCHAFKIPETVVAFYAAKLELTHAGLIVEASQLDEIASIQPKSTARSKKEKPAKSKKGKSVVDDEAMEVDGEEESDEEVQETVSAPVNPATYSQEYMNRIHDYVKECMSNNPRSTTSKSSLVVDALRKLEREFMRALSTSNTSACNRCGGYSPKLRKVDDVNIFQSPLGQNYKVLMAARGLTFESLFGESTIAASHPVGKVEERDRYLTPIQVRQHMNLLWKKETLILDLLFGSVKPGTRVRRSDSGMFFSEVVAVTPNRFRPVSKMGDMLFEHPQNIQLVDILKSNLALYELRKQTEEIQAKAEKEGSIEAELAADAQKDDRFRRMIDAWQKLQRAVNNLIDSSKAPTAGGKLAPPGIRQILEKKEGLFRKHMMGKRVNYAARSVISPDPYIETNEIGIPPVFAKKLTYPEPVTPHNVKKLRQFVINGPNTWPGATHIQNEDGALVSLASFDEAGRRALANQLLTPPVPKNPQLAFRLSSTPKKVYRHLLNGDFLLLNRQPTLHKPSIMAHTARVLPGEKTIRMHYANCNTYNADFDGDEMNAHLPQNAVARAEAMIIARTDQQYLVPTDGGVLRGLIQDHVDAGVDMCSRDTFLTRAEYMQLLYIGLLPEGSLAHAQTIGNGNIEQKIPIGRKGRIVTLPPAIKKPVERWTGKQVISTILANLLPEDRVHLNLKSKSRIPAKQWGPSAPEEQQVWFMDGYLLTGILDKSQFGASAKGLVHGVYEVYGAAYAGKLLSILGRLFTGYLQMVGFSCRMDDLRLTDKGDEVRKGMIDGAKAIGLEATSEYVGLSVDEGKSDSAGIKRKLDRAVESVIRDSEKMAGLDSAMKSRTNKVTSSIISSCIPDHLLKPFPHNNMQVMTVSGAKGSAVNVSQISCLLGQQELEGKRVPMMISGKTLPSFLPFDTSARAGGFITGRFLTGIKPQEYYFHCMAGREGLIDTAVKTSRSGYLQRCLIKHLEGLKVHYDHTVRDVDGSVLQFRYGEDALDTVKQTTLKNFDFCALNFRALVKRYNASVLEGAVDEESAKKYIKKQKKKHESGKPGEYSDPVLSVYSPSRYLGAVSDRFREELTEYMEKNPSTLIKPKSDDGKATRPSWSAPFISTSKFSGLMNVKYMHSLVDPGEAVGLLAAQSIGEPSTQMTLNTFHFAGFGAKNVTLGIPRLREIIMTASDHIKTPLMRLPMKAGVSREEGDAICERISKLVLAQIMENVTVTEELKSKNSDGQSDRKKYITVRLQFWPKSAYQSQYQISPEKLGRVLEKQFIPALERLIVKTLKAGTRKVKEDDVGVAEQGDRPSKKKTGDSDDEAEKEVPPPRAKRSRKKSEEVDSDDEENGADADSDLEAADGDATDSRLLNRRSQHATYDAPDDDDAAIMKAADELSDDEDDEAPKRTSSSHYEDEENMEIDVEKQTDSDRNREQRIATRSRYAKNYKFDNKDGMWCEIVLSFPADTKKMLMVAMVEAVCKSVVIREIPGIQKCYPLPNDSENDTSINIGTDGVNLSGLYEYDHIIDMSQIYTNDVSAILKTFGVEAARAAIMKEIAGVFGVYGISVDSRHLSIIADYMTFEGGYKPFNRIGINSNPSPFAQMSFETTTNFLTTATLSGDFDPLESPSARLVVGQPVKGGTGSFDVLQQLTGF